MSQISTQGYLENAYLAVEGYLGGTAVDATASQFRVLNSGTKLVGAQTKVIETKNTYVGAQFRAINNKVAYVGSQFRNLNSGLSYRGAQVKVIATKFAYAGAQFKAFNTKNAYAGSQFKNQNSKTSYIGAQFKGNNAALARIGAQAKVTQSRLAYAGAQAKVIETKNAFTGSQAAITNTTSKYFGAQFNNSRSNTSYTAEQFNVRNSKLVYVAAQFRASSLATANLSAAQFKDLNAQRLLVGAQFKATNSKLNSTGEQFKVSHSDGLARSGAQFNKAAHFWRTVPFYLQNDAYLNEPYYLGNLQENLINQQFKIVQTKTNLTASQFRVFNTKQFANAAQLKVSNTKSAYNAAQLNNTKAVTQFAGAQFKNLNASKVSTSAQFSVTNSKLIYRGAQFKAVITPTPSLAGGQFKVFSTQRNLTAEQLRSSNPYGSKNSAAQFAVAAVGAAKVGEQFKVSHTDGLRRNAAQFNKAAHYWRNVPFYLQANAYLNEPYYLGALQENLINQQFTVVNTIRRIACAQFSVTNTKQKYPASQFKVINTKTRYNAAQFRVNQQFLIGAQVRVSIYNTTNLRILTTFPSRGTAALGGNNWTSTSTQAGDFLTKNLNTDIVEQYWRSATGVTTNVQLKCETGLTQGAFVDTIALLGHNLSGGASILVEASNSSSFATTDLTFNMKREAINSYYIADTLPLLGFRYWRFTLNDVGNSDGFIKVGTLVFGSAQILAGECFTDVVKLNRKQFVDGVFTEGFTNVKNDRGQKKNISLDFQSLDFTKANYKLLRNVTETYGTILKCLWIPTPKYASRFAVYGKLVDLPSESHNDRGESANYVTMNFNIDEAE